jgi:hypothetical protein
MIFQHLQKIQKPCLVLITAFITVTFGIGTAIITFVSRPEIAGIIDRQKVTREQFDAHRRLLFLTRPYFKDQINNEAVWVDMMINQERLKAGVTSTQEEVLQDLRKMSGETSEEEFQKNMVEQVSNLSENARLTEGEYFYVLKRNHAIDKFRRFMGLELKKQIFPQYNNYLLVNYVTASPSYAETLVTAPEALEKLKEDQSTLKLRWTEKKYGDYYPQVQLKEALKRRYDSAPMSFKVPRKIAGEYLFCPNQGGSFHQRASLGELFHYYKEFRDEFEKPKAKKEDPTTYKAFEDIQEEIQQKIWDKASRDLMNRLKSEWDNNKTRSLKEFAQQHQLLYGSFPLSDSKSFEEHLSELSYSAPEIFRYEAGQLSRVLPYYQKNSIGGQALIHISEVRKPHIPKFASLQNETASLNEEETQALFKHYFHENTFQFEEPIRYQLELAYLDFDHYRLYHTVTTAAMKKFYDDHHKILFGAKSFSEPQVRLDIEKRLKKIQAGEDLPELVQKFRAEWEAQKKENKEKKEDSPPPLSFQELATKYGFKLQLSSQAYSYEELEKNFPLFKGSDFLAHFSKLKQAGDVSEIYETTTGNPFVVRLKEIVYPDSVTFESVKNKIKEKILQSEARLVAEKDLESLQEKAEEYFRFALLSVDETSKLEVRVEGSLEDKKYVLWKGEEEIVTFNKFRNTVEKHFNLGAGNVEVSAETFKTFLAVTQEEWNKISPPWNPLELKNKEMAFSSAPETDRSDLKERAFNLKNAGDVGKPVMGEDSAYLLYLESKTPSQESVKKLEILSKKTELRDKKEEDLKKQWTDYEELSEFVDHKVKKETTSTPTEEEIP